MGSVAVTFKETSCAEILAVKKDEKMVELKQRISEGIVEGTKQQAANLLVSVKKEKMLELAVEKVEEAVSSPEITWILEKILEQPQVRQGLSIYCFLCSAFFLGLSLYNLHALLNDDDDDDQPPEARRRARRA